MKKNSAPITLSDLVGLLGKINASLDNKLGIQEKRLEAKIESGEKRLEAKIESGEKRIEAKIESGQKEIIRRLDRMGKRNGHVRNQIKKAGKNLSEV